MSTINMLPEQTPFGAPDSVNAAPSPFSPTNGFNGDFFGLSLQPGDDTNHSNNHNTIWGFAPVSPPLHWNAKQDQQQQPLFVNSNLDRDLKNAHVRNGQPTPPLYDDDDDDGGGAGAGGPTYYTTTNTTTAQLDGASIPPDPTDPRLHSGSYSDYSGFDSSNGGDGGSAGIIGGGVGGPKRRRTRDHQKQSFSGFDSSDYDDQRNEKAKREKFLERNRLAASKCRQKKKEHTMLLESRYKEQSDRKELLVAEISHLRSEILGLKNEVLKHAQCGDEPIKLHLAQMVKKITYKDTADGTEVVADAASASESPETPLGQPSMSFGFDDPLHPIDQASAMESFDPQLRRESQGSLVSDSSYAFSADDGFDDLINV